MDALEVLREEHLHIDDEIMELEEVMETPEINYSNLIHSFKTLCNIWNKHEEKEEKVFKVFDKESIRVPVEKMTTEHKMLRGHIRKIWRAINSGSEIEMKQTLDSELNPLIQKIKKHKSDEDEVLYTISIQEFTPEEWKEMSKYV